MEALYKKYRPESLNDIVGQKHITFVLKQALINNKFSHAYLFDGKYGCGKTSLARILASLIACSNDEQKEKVFANASPDIIELDAATNRGIDNIRLLIESAKYYPQELNKKVYIIDEAQQLGKEAISALLKIVEEPPEYLVFIFCTTEGKKILPTISSRCQRFKFHPISFQDISEKLKVISKSENINISDESLFMIAKSSRGSLRDAIVSLEQISVAANGKTIRKENIIKFLGIPSFNGCLNIVKCIFNLDFSSVLDQTNELIMMSVDVKEILLDISEIFRNIMVLKVKNKNFENITDLNEFEINELIKLGENVELKKLCKISNAFLNINEKIDLNINNRFILESTLISCIQYLQDN